MVVALKLAHPPCSEDVVLVTRAADALGIEPFRLFQIAHREWFGRPADERGLERVFVRYLFDQVVPAWVRGFARYVLRAEETDELDPERYGLPRRPQDSVDVSRLESWSAVIWLMAAAFITFAVPALAGV